MRREIDELLERLARIERATRPPGRARRALAILRDLVIAGPLILWLVWLLVAGMLLIAIALVAYV